MFKVKSILAHIILPLFLFITFAFLINNSASARQLTKEERKFYAQNNIIFTVPCDTEADCEPSEEGEVVEPTEEPESPESPESPEFPENPEQPEDPIPPSGGALGHTSVSGFYRQFGNNTVWKCPTSSDNAKIKASGCPLVAIANALHAQSSGITLNTLIDEIKNFHNGCTHKGSLFGSDWSNNGREIVKWGANKHGATFSIISASSIDSTLASGGAVVVGGNRNSGIECSTNRPGGRANVDAGKCLFTGGGHFVTIIGKTASGKYVITNPANGSLATYSLDLITSNNHNLNYYSIKL